MTELLATLVAQENGSGDGSGSAFSLALLPLILVGLYFLMIRPQRKRQKEMQQLQASIGVGDEVMTSSGIYGFITGEEDDLFWLEIDEDVQIRIAKAAIHSRVPDRTEKSGDSAAAETTKQIEAGGLDADDSDGDGDAVDDDDNAAGNGAVDRDAASHNATTEGSDS